MDEFLEMWDAACNLAVRLYRTGDWDTIRSIYSVQTDAKRELAQVLAGEAPVTVLAGAIMYVRDRYGLKTSGGHIRSAVQARKAA